jgi:hypothetical protein
VENITVDLKDLECGYVHLTQSGENETVAGFGKPSKDIKSEKFVD